MASRMDRYKDIESNENLYGRSSKNKRLYDDIDNVYSSNETVIDTSSEIDITKLKQMINNREDLKKRNTYRNILEKKEDNSSKDYIKEYNSAKEYEEKDYDINNLLEKVKAEKEKTLVEKNKKLVNTQYDILKNLDLNNKPKDIYKIDLEEQTKEDDKLQKLISAVTDKNKNDEVMDLFADLKGENTIVTEGFKDEVNEHIKETTKKTVDISINDDVETLDDFLDDSMFTDEDFDDFKNIDKPKKSSIILKILLFILIVGVCTITIFILDSIYDFIPF